MIFSQKSFSFHFGECAFIYVLAFSVVTFAQSGSLAKYKQLEKGNVYINKLDKNGAVYCEEINSNNELLNNTVAAKKSHLLPSLNDQYNLRGLRIILRATDQLMKYPDAILAFRRAAARWERVITTPITTVIDVDYGIQGFGFSFNTGVLGSTWTTIYSAQKDSINYAEVSDVVQKLKNLKPGDSQLNSLYDAIPIPPHSTLNVDLKSGIGTLINLQALGFIESEISADQNINPLGRVPAIAFNSQFAFDLDPSDGIALNQFDFDAICTHEIGHALGFVSVSTFIDHFLTEDLFTPWDLFRVRPEAVEPGSLEGFSTAQRVNTAGPANREVWTTENGITYFYSTHVFFDGISEMELSTANGERGGGDGQQSSHWRNDDLRPPSLGTNRWIGIMDPTLYPGVRLQLNNRDLRMLEVIGYGIDYDYKYSNMRILHGQDTLDLSKGTDTLKLSIPQVNTPGQIQLQVTNLGLENPLHYEFELILHDVQPSSVLLTFDGRSGSIAPGLTEQVTLSLSSRSEIASFLGTIRIHTNDENKLVIDLPFELLVGGAIRPQISVSIDDLGDFSFITDNDPKIQTKTFTISNLGNLPLLSDVFITLSAKSSNPGGLLKSSLPKSNLDQFYVNANSMRAYTLYSSDFEDPDNFGGFKQVNTNQDEWQKATIGPAIFKGHSKPTAIHFGKEVDGELSYDDNVTGFFYSPDLSWEFQRNVSPEDILCLSFKYYNRVESGGDIVSLMSSKDSRRTWHEIGSSRTKGILKEHSNEWETVVLQLPDVTNPLLNDRYFSAFGFSFSSDGSVVDQGFFLDDFEVTVLKGQNPVYLWKDYAYLPTMNSSNELFLTVNGTILAPGFYEGSLSLISNDYKNSTKTISFTINNTANVVFNKATKGTLYASSESQNSGSVIQIDKNTGKGTNVGSSGFATLKSISINPQTDELFGFTYSPGLTNVIKVDGKNGFGIHQFRTSVPLSTMAFTPSGELLGIATPPPSGKFDVPAQRLYKINLTSGDAQSLTALKIKAAAMAIEPATGDIWISVDTTEDKDKIYKIDVTTGDTTFIGRAEIGNKTIRALAFDNHGNLWGAYGEKNVVGTFIKIDKMTGVATSIGTTGYEGITGLVFAPDSLTSIDHEQTNPNSYALFNNYPNPFNPSTVISYQLPENSFVILKVFDVLGNEVESLVNEYQTAGVKTITLDLREKEFSSGIYFYQLKAGIFCQTKKMLLLK